MAESPSPVPHPASSGRRRRGALLLIGLSAAIVVLSVVAWYALTSGSRDPPPVARVVQEPGAAGRPSSPTVADPKSPPLEAGGVPDVLPPRSVESPLREDDQEHWSTPRPGATEPWLEVQVVDAAT